MALLEMIQLDLFAKAEARVYYRVDEMKNAGQTSFNTDIKDLTERAHGTWKKELFATAAESKRAVGAVIANWDRCHESDNELCLTYSVTKIPNGHGYVGGHLRRIGAGMTVKCRVFNDVDKAQHVHQDCENFAE